MCLSARMDLVAFIILCFTSTVLSIKNMIVDRKHANYLVNSNIHISLVTFSVSGAFAHFLSRLTVVFDVFIACTLLSSPISIVNSFVLCLHSANFFVDGKNQFCFIFFTVMSYVDGESPCSMMLLVILALVMR